MNYSELPIIYSKENLTNRFVDYSNVYLLPSICGFGIITSFICIVVSLKRDESNAKTFDYILLNSLIDFFFLLIECFLFFIRCGILCPYGYTWFAKFYEIYIYLYVGYVLISSQVFLNIYVAHDRLKMFSANKSAQKQISIYKVYLVLAVISILINLLPFVISREVIPLGIYKPDPNSTYTEILYIRIFRQEFMTATMQTILTVYGAFKDPLFFCILLVISFMVCLRFRTYLKARHILLKSFALGMHLLN